MTTFALITSHAPSLVNFRGPLISALVAKNIRVYALAPNFDNGVRAAVRALGAVPIDCQLNRAGMNPLTDAINTIKLFFLLRQLKADVVLSYFVKPVIFGTIAAWLAGVRHRFAMIEGLGFVFTADSDATTFKRRFLKKGVMHLYRVALARAEKVIFLNPDDMSEFVDSKIIPRDKAFQLGGIGVDLDEWECTVPVSDPVTFILIARLLREKGVEEFVAAAQIIKEKFPSVKFIMLGGLDENPGSISNKQVRAWTETGVIEWLGHVPVAGWLQASSVFVLPSYYREGVPRSTQEAMACGRAVITTDSPGCRETVVHGVNGFLIPTKDPVQLAKTMEHFIQKPELIQSMGAASRKIAEEKFDMFEVNSRLIGVLLVEREKGRNETCI